jgi:hypothetical protein
MNEFAKNIAVKARNSMAHGTHKFFWRVGLCALVAKESEKVEKA